GADRHASGARTAVLAGVTEVGDNRGDAGSRGTTEGIGHHDQFHQVVVGWCTGRLNQEDVLAADIFVDFDHDFAVGKLTDRSIAEGNVQLTYDPSRQVGVCVPREDHHLGHAQYLPAEGIPGWVWKMAGAAGFEPTHARIKTWCLTAWRRPYILCRMLLIRFPMPPGGGYGRGGWIRTNACQDQNLVPYRLATPLYRITEC